MYPALVELYLFYGIAAALLVLLIIVKFFVKEW